MHLQRSIAAGIASLMLLGASSGSPTSVSKTDRAAEAARWQNLGIAVPAAGIVRENPYDAPYDNRSFVVPWKWYRDYYKRIKAHERITVDADDLRADLPILRTLLAKAYVGYETATAHGWDWGRMFSRWDAGLRAAHGKKLPLEAAFAPWGELENVQLDNHSGVPGLFSFVSGSKSAVLKSVPAHPCAKLMFADGSSTSLSADDAGQQPHAVMQWGDALEPAWYVSYPERLGTATAVVCAGKSIALTPVERAAPASDKPEFRELAPGVGYLRMPTFSDANDEALRAAAREAPLAKQRVLIVDLRDNEGGNAPVDVLARFVPKDALDEAAALPTQYGTKSCFRTALFFGLEQQLLGGVSKPLSAELHATLQGLVDGLDGRATPNCDVERSATESKRTLADHHFSARAPVSGTRIVALVDNGCGSDCEYMAYMIAGLPNAVVVGSSTYGVMGFTQPGYAFLPHSRVPFRMALSRTDAYGDGRSVDGYGITVDVLLPSKASQSDESLRAFAQELIRP